MDHKDHFEHLRTVHFSLVITCLGLLVVSTTSQDRTIAGAEAQLRAMQSIVLHWKDLDFDTAINEQVKQSSSELPKDRSIQIRKDDDYQVRFAEPAWSPPSNETCSPWLYDPMLKRAPRTLSDAHELWNCLVSANTFAIPFAFSADAAIADGKKVPLQHGASHKSPKTLQLGFGKTDEDQRAQIRQAFGVSVDYAFTGAAYANDGTQTRVLVPVEKSRFITVDLLAPLTQLDPLFTNASGSFEKSFPDLNEITADYSDLTFDKLTSILASQRKHSVQTFEAFSVKFPSEAIARWGTVLLVGIQLYLLIHIASIQIDEEEESQVAWIPLYRTVLPQMVFLMTVSLLPVFTVYEVSRLGTMSGSRFWDIVAFVAAVAMSTALGWKTAQVFAQRFRGPVPAMLIRIRMFGKRAV
jgi:hypothetical protein